jgi:hypothetical protein
MAEEGKKIKKREKIRLFSYYSNAYHRSRKNKEEFHV